MTITDWRARRRLSFRCSSNSTRRFSGEVPTAIWLLVLLTVAVYLPTPLYPMYQQAYGFSDLILTLIYATMTVIGAPALLLFGPAAEALGQRSIIVLSIALSAVGAVCFLFASGTGWLLAGRAVQGLSIAAATAGCISLIIDRTPIERRVWASLIVAGAFVGGPVVGTAVAGLMVEYSPMPMHAPFWLLLVCLGISVVQASRLTSTPTILLRHWRPARPGVPREIRTRFGLAVAAGSAAWLAMTLFLSVIPALLLRSAGITSPAISGGVLAAMLACSMLTQPLVVRYSADRLQRVGLLALLVSLVGLAVDGGSSLVPTLACAVMAGLGHGLAYSGATSTVEQLTTSQTRGSVNAALYLFLYLATGSPAIAVGILSMGVSLDLALSAMAWFGAALSCVTFLVLALRKRRRIHIMVHSDNESVTQRLV